MITVIDPEPGAKSLLQKLRGGPDDFFTTLLELEVFEKFKKSGYSLKKPIEADGLDFTFQKGGKEVLVEATHRGISWVQNLVDKIAHRSFELSAGKHTSIIPNCRLKVKLEYRKVKEYLNDTELTKPDIIEEIAKKIVEIETTSNINSFEHPNGLYSVEVLEDKKNRLEIGWHETTDYIYESTQLVKNKLTDKQKLSQIQANPGLYISVDMRSLMPYVAMWGGHDRFRISSNFLTSWISYIKQYFETCPNVGGVFLWLSIVGRHEDHIFNLMDQNEIVLIGSQDHLSQVEATKLFPFAKSTQDLTWFSTNL